MLDIYPSKYHDLIKSIERKKSRIIVCTIVAVLVLVLLGSPLEITINGVTKRILLLPTAVSVLLIVVCIQGAMRQNHFCIFGRGASDGRPCGHPCIKKRLSVLQTAVFYMFLFVDCDADAVDLNRFVCADHDVFHTVDDACFDKLAVVGAHLDGNVGHGDL